MGCIVLADLDLLYFVKMADEKNYYEKQLIALEPVSYTHLDVYKRQGYELYSKRWLQYAKNGWKKENDLVLKIGFDSSGLYDIGQEKG